MKKPLREIVPLKEGLARALGMGAAAALAGAATGATNFGGPAIGALPGAAIATAGYVLSGGFKKDYNHTTVKQKIATLPAHRQRAIKIRSAALAEEEKVRRGKK